MFLGKVVGTVVSTSKNEHLVGMKMLIVARMNEKLQFEGNTLIAVDSVGAGANEVVICTTGSSARYIFGKDGRTPVDTTIVGIVDTVEVNDSYG